MRALKNLLPIIGLSILSFYAYDKNAGLAPALVDAMIYLPPGLALLVAYLSVHFNRSSVFFYAVLVLATIFVLDNSWLNTSLAFGLFSGLLPLYLLAFSIVPERSIMSPKAMSAYSILLVTAALSAWAVNETPEWLNYFVLAHWLPVRYFDWTLLSQTVLISTILVFLSLLVLNFVRPSTHRAASLGVLIMLVAQMHYAGEVRSQIIFGSAALLMCLYAVIQESWRMAYLDELTELPARRALREKFQGIGDQYAVAMLDIDHFKKFNDTYGHDVGDDVLCMIAGKLRNVSGSGLPYRYGGEEFAIVFTGKTSDDVKIHLDALCKDIADSRFIINRQDRRSRNKKSSKKQNKSVKVTASIGFALSNGKSSDPWDILKLADKGLYRAKKDGRNCVRRQFGDKAL